MKNILCINTVGTGTQIALTKNGKPERFLDIPFAKHSETLFDSLEEVLSSAKSSLKNLDCLGVVVGPGSFTGIRIGLSVVNTFSFVNKTPVVCVNAFEVLAWCAKQFAKPKQQIYAVMNAGSGQVYFQSFVFDGNFLKKTCEPSVETNEHFKVLLDQTKNVFLCSDAQLDFVKTKVVPFSANALLDAVLQHINQNDFSADIQPLYLRLSQGEICHVKLDKIDFVEAGESEIMALLGVDCQQTATLSWDKSTWINKFEQKCFACKQAIFSGTLVGFVAYSILNKTAKIEKLVVAKSAKGQGVAKFMLGNILEELKNNGTAYVETSFDSKILPAFNLFVSFGFDKQSQTKVGKQTVFVLKKVLL